MKLLLPNTMKLDPHLPADWTSIVVDSAAEIPADHFDADVLVVWGSSKRHLESAARSLGSLRLVQALSAGVDSVLSAKFAPEVMVSSGRGLHDRTVTEHTLAIVLALLRRLPDALNFQGRHEWSREIGGVQELHPSGRVTTLLDARVLIWGFGSIAQTLAPVLRSLGAIVTGVAHESGERSGFPVVDGRGVMAELPRTDVLISVLPATEETREVIGAQVFSALPDRAIVVNVGRGAVVDQLALRDALLAGRIAGAALDVTTPEPLPSDDPLWDTPNLLITPHAAGGRPVGANELIERNVRALVEGRELSNRVV